LAELPLGRTAPEAEAASVNDLKLDRGERQAIEQAVKKHAFNISTAATELELSRGTPYRRWEIMPLDAASRCAELARGAARGARHRESARRL